MFEEHSGTGDASCRKVWNFGAGPAKLPEAVLKRIQREWFDWNGTGMNIVEVSHRSEEFEKLLSKAEKDLRLLLEIPNDYKVLFLQGGATTQFSSIPLNFLGTLNAKVDYCVTGIWSEKASIEAGRYTGNIHFVLDKKTTDNFTKLPPIRNLKFSEDAAYAYFCSNETINGLEFQEIPEPPRNVPLIADMSSDFLTRPIDVSRFGMIYAGAQKNVGPAGLVIVIVRENLLGLALPHTPLMLDYNIHAKHHSMYNTPPTFSIYFAGLVFEWLIEQGGLRTMRDITLQKAKLIYDVIDASNQFYVCPIDPSCRSLVTICFRINGGNEIDEKRFLSMAEKEEMIQLGGHRSVGGLRASLYNAMPIEGVQKLAKFMCDFQSCSS